MSLELQERRLCPAIVAWQNEGAAGNTNGNGALGGKLFLGGLQDGSNATAARLAAAQALAFLASSEGVHKDRDSILRHKMCALAHLRSLLGACRIPETCSGAAVHASRDAQRSRQDPLRPDCAALGHASRDLIGRPLGACPDYGQAAAGSDCTSQRCYSLRCVQKTLLCMCSAVRQPVGQ